MTNPSTFEIPCWILEIQSGQNPPHHTRFLDAGRLLVEAAEGEDEAVVIDAEAMQ